MVRAENRKYHYIYKTTCNVTGRYYIGMHSTDDLNDGYQGSGKVLWYSIRKHGVENHITEILEFVSSRLDLRDRELQIVNEELLVDSKCMNLKLGGEGGWDYEKVGKKGNESQKNLRETNPDWRANKSKAISNKVKSNRKLMDKLRIRMKERHDKGIHNCATFGMLGKEHSEESKIRMSESHIGEKNSQFGTCWIHSLVEKRSQKIDKANLEEWIQNDWILGRKIKY